MFGRFKMNKIKQLRIQFQKTQVQVANSLGISQQLLSKYEKGSQIPTDILIKMSKYFNVSIDYLLGNDFFQTVGDNNLINYSEKQEELLPLIQMLNDRQCELTYDYLNNILDIATAQQEKWGM